MNSGCQLSPGRPLLRLRTGGAQIATRLVESWLEDARGYNFELEHPEFPTWSDRGFGLLLAGECDLACTDRPISETERKKFADRKIQGYRVAFYGYALYVHPDNRLDSIFSRHIRMVFTKRLSDWKQLAGEEVPGLEGPINLYGPP
ncbi:MAG: hypothetical protein GY953_41160, partial [bacterium]|nr:hypothetical protein [bacterium]